MSASKKIILGVTGSIAAHKAADLASLLTKAKCDVRAVMTATEAKTAALQELALSSRYSDGLATGTGAQLDPKHV